MGVSTDQPRSFRISGGPSDLWTLLIALAIGGVYIAWPSAGPWIMRAGLVVVAVLLWAYVRSVRRLLGAGMWARSDRGVGSTVIGLCVLGFWVWIFARGFAAGQWLDASLGSVMGSSVFI